MTTDPRPCTGPDADLWTSDAPEDRVIAAGMCSGCPVATREACLAGAVERREKFCVYGGVDFGMNDGRAGFLCSADWNCGGKVAGFGHRLVSKPRDKSQFERATVPTCARHSFVRLEVAS